MLWLPDAGLYAVFQGGSPPNLTKFYPDAQAQLFPSLVSLPQPGGQQREASLAKQFVGAVGDAWAECSVDAFPQATLALPLIKGGQSKTVACYKTVALAKFAPTFAWPWHIGEAGAYVAMLGALAERSLV